MIRSALSKPLDKFRASGSPIGGLCNNKRLNLIRYLVRLLKARLLFLRIFGRCGALSIFLSASSNGICGIAIGSVEYFLGFIAVSYCRPPARQVYQYRGPHRARSQRSLQRDLESAPQSGLTSNA